MSTVEQKTPEPPATGLVLRVAPLDGVARFVPEQATSFELTVQNRTGAPQSLVKLDGNQFTPQVSVYDDRGQLKFSKTPADKSERVVGDDGPRQPRPPRTISLAPDAVDRSVVNLGKYADQLPTGRYAIQVSHGADPSGAALLSPRVPFEIVDAKVHAAVMGYDSSDHTVSALFWVAEAAGDKPRLLGRLSGFSGHRTVQQAHTLGEAPPGARLAASHVPPDGSPRFLGWIAVAHGREVELIRHNMTKPLWRSGPIALPIDDATPVPRFPDRDHAVLLATGKKGGAPALAGVVAAMNAPLGVAWSVPLAAPPSLAVCAFGASGAISVLYASDDGQSTRFSRIDVDEKGAVLVPEGVVRSSPNRAVALAVDMRRGAPVSFLIMEGSRALHNRLALVRLPLAGAPPPIVPFAPLQGWPVADGDPNKPLRAQVVVLEPSLRGAPHLALIDERGQLFGGALDGGAIGHLPGCGPSPLFPHIAVLHDTITTSCFNQQGHLIHAGG